MLICTGMSKPVGTTLTPYVVLRSASVTGVNSK
jgi:hypothetical protein